MGDTSGRLTEHECRAYRRKDNTLRYLLLERTSETRDGYSSSYIAALHSTLHDDMPCTDAVIGAVIQLRAPKHHARLIRSDTVQLLSI